MTVEAAGMVNKVAVFGCAVLAIGLGGWGPGCATARAEGPMDQSSVQAVDVGPDQGDVLPPRAAEALDEFRRAGADAALGQPVVYGDGQCYPVVQHYIQALGYPWHNTDPSGNAFDLYQHFPTNGLGNFFEQVPFDGGHNTPQVGDIVVYGPGGFVSEHGHAGVVTAVRGGGSLFGYEVAEQNSSGRLFVTLNWRDFSPAYNTLGYLRPKV